VSIVHLSFDTMVGTSFVLLGLSGWFATAWWRRRDLPRSQWFWRGAAVAGVLAVVCLETGWVVTEVGRQPWTVNGLLLTRDAVTTSGNLWLFFAATVALYAAVGAAAIFVLRSMQRTWGRTEDADVHVPYGPPPRSAAA
jgi:cytochrome d ubiquinol oxidase subunit I